MQRSLENKLIRTTILSFLLLISVPLLPSVQGQHFTSGIKIGEVDQTSAIIWARLTKKPVASFALADPSLKHPMPTKVVEGQSGEMMLACSTFRDTVEVVFSKKVTVGPETDFTHQFVLSDLKPNTEYQVSINSFKPDTKTPANVIEGKFRTAPDDTQTVPVRFIVSTCQACRSVDSGHDGHAAYARMLDFKPDFFVHTGDILYYDKLPLAKTVDQARAKWNLMFSFGFNKKFHQQVPSYFMKDDHDTLKNDCWPGQSYGEIKFEDGLAIFREQVPMGEKTYRTFRWGKDVQIWLTENRDFRSPNNIKDGPTKTILGVKQKEWLKKSLTESNATLKFVISPGPIVGPDKKGKSDNHSNKAFAHEGQELRDFLSKLPNTYVICGDRHWQYCSEDPKTGLVELGCGAINDQHDFGGDPGEDPDFHRYFSNKGGFLGVIVEDGKAKATWFGVNGADGAVLPEAKALHTESLGK